jgi:hypothetical protein
MKTKREQHKQWQKYINDNIDRKGMSDCHIDFNEEVSLKDKEEHLVNAIVDILEFESNVLEIDTPRICASLLFAMKGFPEKISKLNSLIQILQMTLKTAETNSQTNMGIIIGRLEQDLSQSSIPSITEYSVKEFAKLVKLHPHTVRKRFSLGELNGRQDRKGIFIAASELKKYVSDTKENE